MINNLAYRVKSNAHFQCQDCGSTELIQAHHEVPKDDSSLVVLCAECHSKKHPKVPRALFFSGNQQPYWNNKSASSLARQWGVISRTVIRAARKLGIHAGELSIWDEELIKSNIPKINRKPKSNNKEFESPQGTRTETMIVRLTPEEKTLMVEQAKKYRISLSALVRLMLGELSKRDLRFK